MIDEPLGASARALLDSARAGLGPDAHAVRRMREQIAITTGTATAATGLAAKLASLGVVGGLLAVVAIGALVVRSTDPAPAPAIAPILDLPGVQTEPFVPSSRAVSSASLDAEPPIAIPATRRPAVAVVDLAREVALIDVAMAALRSGRPRDALDAVHVHAAETRDRGQLAEDAAAIEIEALCELADPAATAKLARFDVRFPRSAQRTRLDTTCR